MGGFSQWGAQPCGGGVAMGGGCPPRQHVHDSIRPIRLTVALGLKQGCVSCVGASCTRVVTIRSKGR